MVGVYKRTDEIKEKQRIKMKEKVKSYDFTEIDKKRKATLLMNNKKPGRKPGEGKPKTGWHKKCKMCENMIYVTKTTSESRTYCSRVCLFDDPDYKEKMKNKERPWLEKVYNRGSKLTDSYKVYKNKVYRLTEKTYIENFSILNPNNFVRTLCGVEDGYQLDHIKSIKKCYNEGLTPEQASDISNIKLIPWENNLEKRTFEQIERKT